MDILVSSPQLTPVDFQRDKHRLQFSCSAKTVQGVNPRPGHIFPILSVTGYSPVY